MGETIYRRHSLAELSDPWLLRALKAWRRICDARGRYTLGENLSPILDNRELILPASTLFLVDGDDPRDWIVIWQGSQARDGLGHNLTGCRWGDYVDERYAAAAADQLARTVAEAEVVYDEVWAHINGKPLHYDRLAFPVMWKDSVDLLLTVARWRTPILH